MKPTAEQWRRWLEGTANDEEMSALQEWLTESEANRQQWEDYLQLWTTYGLVADALHRQEPSAKDHAWQRLYSEIQSENHTTRRLPVRTFASIAAAIALLLVAAMVWIWLQPPVQVLAVAETITCTLPDGSKVALRAGSRLSYPRFFNHSTRRLQLDGEAFFDVKRNEKLPFVVQCGMAEVKVLGTSFLIETSGRDSTRLSVYTGLTALYAPDMKTRLQYLKAGESAVLSSEGISIRPFSNGRQAWKVGFKKYEAAPLAEILQDWQHWHGLSVRCEGSEMPDCRLTVELSTDDATASLELIAAVLRMQVEKVGPNDFILRGGNCN